MISVISDLLSGRLFRFKTAKGSDVELGTSDKLLMTPKSFKDSYFFGINSVSHLSFGLDSQLSTNSQTVVIGTRFELIAPTGDSYFFSGRGNSFSARLMVYAKADSGAAGEISLIDAASGQVVTGSTIPVTQTSLTVLSSGVFTISSAKVYTYGYRKASGGLFSNIYLRSALLTFLIPKT